MTGSHFKRIVAATDFSEDAGHAALRAALLASEHRAELELLHVVSESSLDAMRAWVDSPVVERLLEDVGRTVSEQAADISARTSISARSRVTIGDVLSEIVSACERADLLVVGVRGMNSLRDAFLGTTAERALGKCRQPILVVKRPPSQSYARVLVPLDLTSNSERVLQLATRIAPHGMIVALHAYELLFEARLRLAGATDDEIKTHLSRVEEKAAAEIGALWQRTGIIQRFDHVVKRGSPMVVIAEQQQRQASDLIVIGKHSKAGIGPSFLGSVARHVLAESVCDVLVLPAPDGAGGAKATSAKTPASVAAA